MIRSCSLLGCFFVASALVSADAAEWPQYRGPDLNGVSAEKASPAWAGAGPKTVWKVPTENGFSSFAVSGGKAFTIVGRGGKEVCVALDAANGKELWTAELDVAKYEGGGDSGTPDNKGGDGPRSTPTVNDGKVYAFSQGLILSCFDANSGKQIWSHDLMKEFAGHNITWKNASSPVIDGDLVFVAGGGAGQSFLAFNKADGKLAWKTGDDTITHATPVVATILGERQVIFFMKSGLVSLSPKDGKELWRAPYKFAVSTAISPVVDGDIVYCSAGYGVGGGAFKISKDGAAFKATQMWQTPGDKLVANHWSTPVVKDGHLYGMFSFKKYGVGPLKCVEIATGSVKWEQPNFGAGNVTLVGDKLIALADNGEVVVVEATPSAYKEVCRTKAVAGKCWSTPAFSDGKIYVRSTKEGACLDPSAK